QVISPVLLVKNTSLIVATSPGDASNWVSKVINARGKDGQPIVGSMHLATPCKECEKTGNKTGDCPHKNQLEVAHKSTQAKRRWAEIYEKLGREDIYRRENMGLITQ